jgi:hypothetical protein
MKLLDTLLGRRRSFKRVTTADNPLRISNARIGFLNLQGEPGVEPLEADRRILSSRFKTSQVSNDAIPKCEVLFIYCTLNSQGRVVGSSANVRDIIKEAGAYVAVVASNNAPATYMDCLKPKNGWFANVVMVIDRRDERLAEFLRDLFERMFGGTSMLVAWVQLAPQGAWGSRSERSEYYHGGRSGTCNV